MQPVNHNPAGPPASELPTPQPQTPDNLQSLSAQIVEEIPMRAPASGAHGRTNDDELDMIMQDVGNQMKAEANMPHKKHLLSIFEKHDKPSEPEKVQQQPKPKPDSIEALSLPPIVQAHATPKPQPNAAQLPAKKSNAPVLVILATIAVTSALIIAAFSAYK